MFFATRFDIYKPVVPIIQKGIDASGKQEWIDCASGGGGSLIRLAEHLKSEYPELKITLTDYFPNEEAFERTIKYNPKVFSYEKGSVQFPLKEELPLDLIRRIVLFRKEENASKQLTKKKPL